MSDNPYHYTPRQILGICLVMFLIGAALGVIGGVGHTQDAWREEAIELGYGEWVVIDKKNGIVDWRWKRPPGKPLEE
jgi:hypothetical protein